MGMLKFSHIAINCRDMAAIESFYTKFFGFRRARMIDLGDDQIVFLRNGDAYLELFRAKGDGPAPADKDGPTYAGFRHIAFQVDDVDAQLKAMGDAAQISHGPFSFNDFIPGWRTVWVKDPEGNVVEISQGFRDEEPKK
jgi:glyoxylase I family protein